MGTLRVPRARSIGWIWLCLCDPSGMPENGSATMLTARQPAVRVVGFFYPVRAVRPVGSRCPDI